MASQVAPAQQTKLAADVAGHRAVVEPFLTKHCVHCHGGDDPAGGFSMAGLDGDLLSGPHVDKWERISQQLLLGQMPPADEPRPDPATTAQVNRWLSGELRKAGRATPAEKLLRPGYGNLVPHALLFDRDPATLRPAASPARLWRLSPYAYASLAYDLSRQERMPQPFALEAGDGMKDFAALYSLDEPTTDLLIRNALQMASLQMWHEFQDGKIRGGWRTPKEALALLDPANQSPTPEQFAALIRKQYELVLLRSPSDDELRASLALLESTRRDSNLQRGMQTALAAVILSPEAVFRGELGAGAPDEHGRVMLSPRELSYAISFALTDKRPDGPLQRALADGKLSRRDDVRREVERLYDDAKTAKPRVLRFFREYFGYGQAEDVFKDAKENEDHDARVLVSDTDQLVEYILASDKNVLVELLTTDKSFVNYRPDNNGGAKSQERKRIHTAYGLALDWKWTAQQPVTLDRAQRAGVLTQPSWLVTHSANTENHAIRRGKWVRECLLGGAVPDVPITVDAKLPEDPAKTLRQRMAVTQETYCWQCHQKMNPLGLPFEAYDHFGRFRDAELDHPVDASGTIADSGDPRLDGAVDDAVDMIHRIAGSQRVRQVFVRHAFRYWLGRNETPADAATLIAADRAYQESGGSFRALVVSLLTSDSFLYRWTEKTDNTLTGPDAPQDK
ncbi:MAG: DUF1588 domain-containing protein [Planctomycetales bacterium]|nr:DUF1588 domain-containing protein [Planctomycetales bacterium]